MSAVVKEKQERAPYKTKQMRNEFDAAMSTRFPIGSRALVHRGRGVSDVKVLSACRRGKIEVVNLISGKQYWATAEGMRPNPVSLRRIASPVATQERNRPSIVRQFLQPITTVSARSDEGKEARDQVRLMPLSSDELVAYTAINAVRKTLNHLHQNSDSFRDKKHFGLLESAHILLTTITQKVESYNELPEEA